MKRLTIIAVCALTLVATPALAQNYEVHGADDAVVHSIKGYAVGPAAAEVLVIEDDGEINLNDTLDLFLGSSDDCVLRWDTVQTQDALLLGLGASNTLLIVEKADSGADLALAAQTYPSVVIYDADANNYVKVGHSADNVATITSSAALNVTTTGALTVTAGGALSINSSSTMDFSGTSLDGFGGYNIIYCGDLLNATTNYLGPATGAFFNDGVDYSPTSPGCAGLDKAAEVDADEVILDSINWRVTGMLCTLTNAAADHVTFTMRSAVANLTPSVSCIVDGGKKTCWAITSTTTNIATAAATCVQAVPLGDESANDGWCKVLMTPQDCTLCGV